MDAEAELAQEQAAVNAFRMHCRLKLDELVDSLMDLRAEKQAYLTCMELLRQGINLTWLEEDDFLAKIGGAWCRTSWARRSPRLEVEVDGLKAQLERMEQKTV